MCTRIRAALAAAPLVMALVLSGCSSDDDTDEVASVSGDSQTDGTDADSEPSQQEIDDAALAFAECMRKHGIDMDDPEPGEGLRLRVTPDDEAAMDDAMAACEDLMPRGPRGDGSGEDMQEDMLAMAECMRENGVEAFPDPEPGQGIRITPEIGEDPDFESAQEACRNGMGATEEESSL